MPKRHPDYMGGWLTSFALPRVYLVARTRTSFRHVSPPFEALPLHPYTHVAMAPVCQAPLHSQSPTITVTARGDSNRNESSRAQLLVPPPLPALKWEMLKQVFTSPHLKPPHPLSTLPMRSRTCHPLFSTYWATLPALQLTPSPQTPPPNS